MALSREPILDCALYCFFSEKIFTLLAGVVCSVRDPTLLVTLAYFLVDVVVVIVVFESKSHHVPTKTSNPCDHKQHLAKQ